MLIKANYVDLQKREIFPAQLEIHGEKIISVKKIEEEQDTYILPGFVDAHIHIESSMVTPLSFSRAALPSGTLAVVSDPHEIANVMGEEGVLFMLDSARKTPMKIIFGAPSCVPATDFESSGAVLDDQSLRSLLSMEGIEYMSEMMNYPGVVYDDPLVWKKLELAKELGVPVDGHAPGLSGDDLKKYVNAGISTDHECFTIEEAIEKISLGMKILIREGSGAKNYEALIPLLKSHPEYIMFCSDDLHPDDLQKGHINLLVKRSLQKGYDLFDTLRAASWNAVMHYKLPLGLLRENDPADFILVDNLNDLNILASYLNGVAVYENGSLNFSGEIENPINKFEIGTLSESDFHLPVRQESKIRIIEAIDGELITREKTDKPLFIDGNTVSDTGRDILKMTVVNRYRSSKPALAFINGFNLKRGAIASSIAHDSHNIVCVGASDKEITETVNWIIENKGGIAIHDGTRVEGLALNVAGILTTSPVEEAAKKYEILNEQAKLLGSTLQAPFMTLAFMSLLVIPDLKLSDKGLFDGKDFTFTTLFVDNE